MSRYPKQLRTQLIRAMQADPLARCWAEGAAAMARVTLAEWVRLDRAGQTPQSKLIDGCRSWRTADVLDWYTARTMGD